MKNLSRRDFIKGSLAAVATFGLAATTGCGQNEVPEGTTAAPETGAAEKPAATGASSGSINFEDTVSWNAEYDAVVVGFGSAGGIASIDLADSGLNVALIEKAPYGHEGGNTRYSSQRFLVVDPKDKDKMITYMNLMHFGIRMPKTVSGPLHYSLLDNEDFLRNLINVIPFPIVVKGNFGSMGENVFLAHDYEELKQIETKVAYRPRLYQEFIESSKGFDYRLVCVGGKYVAGYKRLSLSDDFRSNIAQGGVGVEHTMSPFQIETAERIARALALDYCGIDLLESGIREEPILCEVNSNAFLQGIEKTTGVNVAKVYADHIFDEIYRI
jgi:RimK family alpha-L-glutamate ligase